MVSNLYERKGVSVLDEIWQEDRAARSLQRKQTLEADVSLFIGKTWTSIGDWTS